MLTLLLIAPLTAVLIQKVQVAEGLHPHQSRVVIQMGLPVKTLIRVPAAIILPVIVAAGR